MNMNIDQKDYYKDIKIKIISILNSIYYKKKFLIIIILL